MMTAGPATSRLLVIGDLDRLRGIVRDCFAPHPIEGVRNYLQGVAEIKRAPTSAVLVGHDPTCRQPEAAVAAMKQVAGAAPVVFCCEPAYEGLAKKLVAAGADDYVIFPPEPADLERALKMPGRQTKSRWLSMPSAVPTPTAEELARLAELLPSLSVADTRTLDAMAELICCAIRAESATVLFDSVVGRCGDGPEGRSGAILIEPILRGTQAVGQIRVGNSRSGGFSHEDTDKLRHYGVLFGRLLESAAKADEWRRLAFVDDLTGLPNRRRLAAFLDEKLTLAAQSRTTVSLLIFDIDDFKRYNDRYGHDAGDEILRDTGRLFVQCSRNTDLVARYGGDEFVVVFWDAEAPRSLGSHHPSEVVAVIHRFRDALRKHTFSRLGPEAQGFLTISGGLAQFPWQAHSGDELIAAADRALFQAKTAGKNRFWLVGSGDLSEDGLESLKSST